MSIYDSLAPTFNDTSQPPAQSFGIYNSLAPSQLQTDATQAQNDANYQESPLGLATNTIKDVFNTGVNAVKDFASSTYNTYAQTPQKLSEDVQTGASGMQNAQTPGQAFNSATVTGIRVAGDTAIAVFAPISAAIGSLLKATGAQTLMDSTGKVIADKTGITDMPAFQNFANQHPNAGEDFNRILTLALSAGDTSEIDPAKMKSDAQALAEKLIPSKVQTPTEESPVVPIKGELPTAPQSTIYDELKPQKPTVSQKTTPAEVKSQENAVPVESKPQETPVEATNKPSGLAKSIETKSIEANLTKKFENVAGYDSSTIKEQAQMFSDAALKGEEHLRSIIRGETPLPDRAKAFPFVVNAETYLKEHPSPELAYELANSPLVTKASEAASELGLGQNREQDSYTAKIQELKRAKVQNDSTPLKKEIRKATETNNLSEEDQSWEKFLNNITC